MDNFAATFELNPVTLTLLVLGVVFGGLIVFIRYRYNKLLLDNERLVNETKDNLLSIASHQLRTPATGVKQYLGLILDGYAGEISEKHHKIIAKAYRSNERQLKTINDVLYLARLGSGRIVTTETDFDIKQLTLDLLDELESEASAKGHKITKSFPKSKVIAHADHHLMGMCIENLLTNAIKYTKPGGKIRVEITTTECEVLVSVKDNGVGIADGEIKELFKQFNRLGNELSASTSGSGIGLYLTKHLMELQGGTIDVTSEHGKGSQFTLKLQKC